MTQRINPDRPQTPAENQARHFAKKARLKAERESKLQAAAGKALFVTIDELAAAILDGEVVIVNEAYYDALLNQE